VLRAVSQAAGPGPLFRATLISWLSCYPCEHAVAQLVKALRYKPEGHGFDSQWFQWNFSLA
jgi:hypothetical protein